MSYHITFKRKLQHVGNKQVICGSHPNCSVDQWVNLLSILHVKPYDLPSSQLAIYIQLAILAGSIVGKQHTLHWYSQLPKTLRINGAGRLVTSKQLAIATPYLFVQLYSQLASKLAKSKVIQLQLTYYTPGINAHALLLHTVYNVLRMHWVYKNQHISINTNIRFDVVCGADHEAVQTINLIRTLLRVY